MREQILEIMKRDLIPFPNRQDNLEYTQEDVILIAETFAKLFKYKADKWDKLDAEISKFYEVDEEDLEDYGEGDLCDIGEIASMHLGYL